MDMLKMIWPLSFKVKEKDVTSLVVQLIVSIVVVAIAGVAIGILVKLPIIGWIVGIFPFMTYMVASMAAFYDDAANREAARQAEFPSLDPDDYTFDFETKNNEE